MSQFGRGRGRGRAGSSAVPTNGHSNAPGPINARPAGMSDEDSDDCDDDFVFSNPTHHRKVTRPRMEERIGADEQMRVACLNGDVNKVLELINGGVADVDGVSKITGWTPLMVAASNGNARVVEVLLEHGAFAGFMSRGPGDELNPLMLTTIAPIAAMGIDNIKECASLLVAAGADVNMANNNGHTPLMHAAKEDKLFLIEDFLNAGAEINAVDRDGKSALEFAANRGSGRAIRMLLEHDADPSLVNEFGMMAWEVALDQEHFVVSDILYKATTTKWRPGLSPDLLNEPVDIANIRKYSVPNRAGEVLECNEKSQIEMVLENLGLQIKLVNFQAHNISYLNFLNLSDEQLIDIGIEAVGDRMKILDAIRDIHNRGWADQSITPIYLKPNITASEMICILNNTKKHMEYVTNTVQFLSKKAAANPEMLEIGIEQYPLAEQVQHTDASLDSISKLQIEVQMLQNELSEMDGRTEFSAADDVSAGRRRFFQKWTTFLGAVALAGAGFVFALRCRKV